MLYDINQTTEQDVWDRNSYFISLYRSLEHLTSNANNIKKLLYYITKYILSKKIKSSKTNKIKNLRGIGEVVYNFISTFYNLEYNALVVNNNNILFRCKVTAKFILKINEMNNSKDKQDKNVDKPATFNKLSSPILVKLPKEMNKISKYFKKNSKLIDKSTKNQSNGNKNQRKLYV